MTPDEFTNQELFLDVSDGHQLYVYDWGKKGVKTPILFLHGGPGAGIHDRYKSRFNPEAQRVIFYDQRGAGKSLPKGSLINNTTEHLIADIQKLVKYLDLDQFVITGGSWGSTLALAYAIKHPKNIKAMVLGGIFTASVEETKHLDEGHYRAFFPDVWDKYKNWAPKQYRDNPSAFHYAQAFSNDPVAAKRSIYAYYEMEGSLLSLDDRPRGGSIEDFDPNDMKIEMHYLKHGCFLAENYIFNNAKKLTMPVWLVQGRYDMVCPPVTAYTLSKHIPHAELIWTVAGHGNDRANYDVIRTILLQIAGER